MVCIDLGSIMLKLTDVHMESHYSAYTSILKIKTKGKKEEGDVGV
jgi:hypothetical protein